MGQLENQIIQLQGIDQRGMHRTGNTFVLMTSVKRNRGVKLSTKRLGRNAQDWQMAACTAVEVLERSAQTDAAI
jgi:hypothetical protein